MTSALSFSESRPAKAILVPTTYLEGFFKKTKRCFSLHMIPLFFMELEYLKVVVAAPRPTTPPREGAAAVLLSPSRAWHAPHYPSKMSLPAAASPSGTDTSGSALAFLGGISYKILFIISVIHTVIFIIFSSIINYHMFSY